MPQIEYEGRSFQIEDKETVLDALLRCGVPVAHSCKAGSCGSCLMRAVDGPVPKNAQSSLKESWQAQGYFLACVCRPENDLRVGAVGAENRPPSAASAGITALFKVPSPSTEPMPSIGRQLTEGPLFIVGPDDALGRSSESPGAYGLAPMQVPKKRFLNEPG